jgi:uncharacterized protein (DUF1501 family)
MIGDRLGKWGPLPCRHHAGVGCVTLSIGSWDTHRDHFAAMRNELPFLDRGVSALVQDLHERGLSNDVVTVVGGSSAGRPGLTATPAATTGRRS